MTSRRSSARVVLVMSGIAIACYGVRTDERQVRAIAADHLDCDPALVSLDGEMTSDKEVARYVVRGCDRRRTLLCRTDESGVVRCESAHASRPSDTGGEADTGAETAVAVASAAGCACLQAIGSSSHSPKSGGAPDPNPNSTTPQRTR